MIVQESIEHIYIYITYICEHKIFRQLESHPVSYHFQGELDEMRIVDGIAGARNIYRRRGDAEEAGGDQLLPKRIKFVMDCSGTLVISFFFMGNDIFLGAWKDGLEWEVNDWNDHLSLMKLWRFRGYRLLLCWAGEKRAVGEVTKQWIWCEYVIYLER